MKDFKEMDQLVFSFGADNNRFVDNYSERMAPAIRGQIQELMFTGFVKEVDAISECEKVDIKYKKRFYNKLLRAKMKLVKLDRADAWFDRVFQKYFNRGILEHLIVYAINFLHKKDLFVAKRLFKQINNDDLLAQFTVAACEYLGWMRQTEVADGLVSDETEITEEEQENIEKVAIDGDEPQDEEVDEQETETQEQSEEEPTVTEKKTDEAATDNDEGQPVALKSEETVTHRFHRPGGKNGKK